MYSTDRMLIASVSCEDETRGRVLHLLPQRRKAETLFI